jgi:pimeloyl-ACP methyl ester carboxylesterase
VLLLPGALCSSVFYDDLLSEPSLADASLRLVATTLPGFGGTTPLTDVSMENYAASGGRLAADLGCDVVVGHSLGANVALEMVAAREFRIADLKNNDPRFLRPQTRAYLEYLDRHGSLAERLCDTGVPAWVAFGSHDEIGLTEDERRVLEACPHVTLTTIADTGHFALNDKPERIAELVLAAVSSVG